MKDIISKTRKEKGLTQQELGDLIGVSDRVISKWETGKSIPDTSILEPLCDALGITINELFASKDEPTKINDIAREDFNLKYKNLSVVAMILEVVVGLFLIIGRIVYEYERFSYEYRGIIGISLIIISGFVFILGVGYLLITRNNIINSYSKYKMIDIIFFRRLLLCLFLVILVVSIVFILLHGLETIEVLITIAICIFVDTIICGLLLFLNSKRK